VNKLFDIEPTHKTGKQKRVSEDDDFVLTFMDALTAPVLTHSITWKDSIPERLLKVITQARLISFLKKEEIATLPETCAFMMTRTFDGPMNHDWTDIYVFVSCTVCEEYFGENRWECVWDKHKPRELNQYQQKLLNNLRKWIYERRRNQVKSRIKSQKREDALVETKKILVKETQFKLL